MRRRGRRSRTRKARYLGKTGRLTELLKSLGKLPADERPAAGARINEAKAKLEAALDRTARRACRGEARAPARRGRARRIAARPRLGASAALHPITRTLQRIETHLSFDRLRRRRRSRDRDDFHNFTALNMPENHPSRSMHDTFYVEGGMVSAHAHLSDPGALHGRRTRRRSRSSRRGASIASTATPRIRRCSTRSKACGSTRT